MDGPGLELPEGHKTWFALSLAVSLVLFAFFVWSIVLYFLRLRYTWKTRRLAAVFLGATIPPTIFSMLMLLAGPLMEKVPGAAAPLVRFAMVVGMLIGFGIVLVQGLTYTAAGAYLSARAGQPHFPLLRNLARAGRRGFAGEWRFPWAAAILVSVGVIGYSAILLWATQPQLSPLLKQTIKSLEGLFLAGHSKTVVAIAASLIAVKEEIVFRLFLQTQFAWWLRGKRRPDLWAILLVSVLWTLAHAISLDPAWVKFAQILPIGIALGLLRRRWGIETCIFVHVALNLAAVFLLGELVTLQ